MTAAISTIPAHRALFSSQIIQLEYALVGQGADAFGRNLLQRGRAVGFHGHLTRRSVPCLVTLGQILRMGRGRGIGVMLGNNQIPLGILGVGVAGRQGQQVAPRLYQHRIYIVRLYNF